MRGFREIQTLLQEHNVKVTKEHDYAHFSYEVAVTPGSDLTAEEMALFVAHGCLCFGGRNYRRNHDGTHYSGVVHTD